MCAPTNPGALDPLLHPADVAKLLKMSVSWLAKQRVAGTGPRFVKVGRAVRYPESAVRDYINSRKRDSTSEDRQRPSRQKRSSTSEDRQSPRHQKRSSTSKDRQRPRHQEWN